MRDKVLVVGMDGLRFDRLTALAPPVLSSLMATGAFGTSRLPYGERQATPGAVVPAVTEREIRSRTDSGPGWSSILTGVWPDKHGVANNGFKGAQYTEFPDFLTRAKQARPELNTSAFFSWVPLDEHGAFGLAIDNRFVLDGEAISFMTADKQLAAAAESHLAEADPDLMFVYLGSTDEVAHDLGPMCQEYADALLTQDAYLGRLLDAIRGRPPYAEESWTIIVTTDHGHVDGGGHGGTSDEERTVFVIAGHLEEDLGGRRLDGLRLVDVGPTALAQLGIGTEAVWELDGTAFFITR